MNSSRLQTNWRYIALFSILIASLGVGCTAPPPASVADREQPPTRKILTHRVSKGETLYSIAWRYGLDYRELARHNGIGPPYTIYASQRLRLDVGNAASRQRSPERVARRPNPEPQPSSTSAPASEPTRSQNQTPKKEPPSPPPSIKGPVRWQWPARGKVIADFTSNDGLNKGIDIGGELGESVVAAGTGRVVYAGSGLRGYGKLLIIKHNQTFLSAYAHNRALLVKEGASVKAGQKVAELGSSGTDENKLHFEIRRDGKPVDPMTYLPGR